MKIYSREDVKAHTLVKFVVILSTQFCTVMNIPSV